MADREIKVKITAEASKAQAAILAASESLSKLGVTLDGATAQSNKLKLVQLQLAEAQFKLAKETDELKKAQLQVRVDELSQDYVKLKAAIDGVGTETVKATGGFKVLGLSLTDLKSGLDMALGAARTFAEFAKQAFDFAKEGATVAAITERFTAFTGGVQEADRWLAELRRATRDTVSDMELMAATTKLVSMGLASNSTEAARMAKMALMLGDQTQSAGDRIADFSLMLANQAVMRLDNFGISSGRVRTRIEELMRTMPGMTRETAFMTAALEEGEVAMNKLGGEITGALTSYQRLEAATKNNTNAFKEFVGEALAPAAEGLWQVLTFQGRVRESLIEFGKTARDTGMSWEEYARRAYEAAAASGQTTLMTNHLREAMRAAGYSLAEINAATRTLEGRMEAAAAVGLGFGNVLSKIDYNAIVAGNAAASQGFRDVGASAASTRQPIEDYTAAQQAAADAASAFAVETMHAAAALGEMKKADFAKSALDALKVSLDAGRISQQEYEAATRAVLVQFGLLTPAEESASAALDALRAMFEAGEIDARGYAAAIQGIKNSLDALKSKTITIGVDFHMGPMPELPGGAGPGGLPGGPIAIPQAQGGDWWVTRPTLFLAGEAGPERATFTPQGQTPPGGNDRQASMVVNINSNQSTGSLYRDLQLLEAML